MVILETTTSFVRFLRNHITNEVLFNAGIQTPDGTYIEIKTNIVSIFVPFIVGLPMIMEHDTLLDINTYTGCE